MTTPVSDQARVDAASAEIAAIIKAEEHNDASIFRVIGELVKFHPEFAHRVSHAVADLLDATKGEINYSYILAEAYCHTLFGPGGPFEHRPESAETFAQSFSALNGSGMASFGTLHSGAMQ